MAAPPTITQGPSQVMMQPGMVMQRTLFYSKATCPHVKRMSIAQIVFGSLAIFFGIACVITSSHAGSYTTDIGTGIWVGVFFLITGLIGLNAANKNSYCLAVANLVMNILTCLASVCLISLSSVFIALVNSSYSYRYYYQFSNRGDDYYSMIYNLMTTFEVILLLFGLAQFGMTIALSVIGCASTCCRSRPYNQGMGMVIPAQPMVVNQSGQMMYVQQPVQQFTGAAQPMYFAPGNGGVMTAVYPNQAPHQFQQYAAGPSNAAVGVHQPFLQPGGSTEHPGQVGVVEKPPVYQQ